VSEALLNKERKREGARDCDVVGLPALEVGMHWDAKNVELPTVLTIIIECITLHVFIITPLFKANFS
jgi:hypothetical protein